MSTQTVTLKQDLVGHSNKINKQCLIKKALYGPFFVVQTNIFVVLYKYRDKQMGEE